MLEIVNGVRRVVRMSYEKYVAKLEAKGQTVDGHEILNPVPLAPPLGYKPVPHLIDQIKEAVRSEMFRRDMEDAGVETFEEADDFDIPDDPFPFSQYENEGDIPVSVLLAEGRKAIAEKQKAAERAAKEEVAEPPAGARKGRVRAPKDDPSPSVDGESE